MNLSSDIELIKAENVSQTFQVADQKIDVLKDVNFSIKSNSFTIVYGHSGSGKSTLLNILSGLQKPSLGSITFNGENIFEYRPNEIAYFRANKIGFVYQQNFWVKSLNVIENVAMPLYFYGYNKKQAKPIVLQALERVGMTSYAKKYPIYMSGGEQQRIAVARAIVNDPMIIIADEPTGSLDSKNGDKIMNILRTAKDEFKHTVILVTHNIEYLPLADHLLHIDDGHVEDMKQSDIAAIAARLIGEQKDRITLMINQNRSIDGSAKIQQV